MSATIDTLFLCCVCVYNQNTRALLLVLLWNLGTLHVKKVTELLHKQQQTQRDKREAKQNRRVLQKTCYVPSPVSRRGWSLLDVVLLVLVPYQIETGVLFHGLL